jgi:hypothetical protein
VGPITSRPQYTSTTYGYYDKIFHLGDEPVEDWAPSLGEMIFAGNMTVQMSTSPRKKYYWEIYQIMGDPSLVPWFRVPGNAPVDYPRVIPEGATQINIKASSYDYIALSSEGVLINAMHADRYGQAYLTVPEQWMNNDLTLVVTGDQRQPLIDTIFRGTNRRGYIELAATAITEESVKADGLISAGESFSLHLEIVNKNNRVFHSGELLLHCYEDFVSIEDSVILSGPIAPGDTIVLTDVFRISIDEGAEDLAVFTLGLNAKTGSPGNTIYWKENVHAPVLSSSGIKWEDRTFGNGNGIIEGGEKLVFHWKIENSGSFKSDSVTVITGNGSKMLSAGLLSERFNGISSGEGELFSFAAEIKDTLIDISGIHLSFEASNGNSQISDSILLVIDRHFEDFSTGDLKRFNWVSSSYEWVPDSMVYRGAPFSLRSGKIPDSQSSSLTIELDVAEIDSIVFDYKVSSEANYDYLKFLVNDVLIARWSGTVEWNQYIHRLEPGSYLLEWMYQKDGNTTRGEDAAWIDNVIFPKHSFDSIDLGILKLTAPVSSKSMGQNEELKLMVINTGSKEIEGFSAGYSLKDSPWIEYQYTEVIAPGEKYEITFPETIDLSDIDSYEVITGISAAGDAYPGNDRVSFFLDHYQYPDLALSFIRIDSVYLVSADLFAEVSNEGNIRIEKLTYEYYLDNELQRMDTALINLDPGSSADISIRLIGEGDDLIEHGWHDYRIVAASDSVNTNNSISGTLFWNIQSIEHQKENQFIVYPNPAGREFTIQLLTNMRIPVYFEIVSIKGHLVYKGQMTESIKTLNGADIFDSAGIYIIQIKGDEGEIISEGKIVVGAR